MPALQGSVGQGGLNSPQDVRAIKELLNYHATKLSFPALDVFDGACDLKTIDAIKKYQRAVLGIRDPDGRVDPKGRTQRSLDHQEVGSNATAQAQEVQRNARLSGLDWFQRNESNYPNSADVQDLAPGFNLHVRDFIWAMERGGANVFVESTLRNKDRAFIMHWAWKVAHGTVDAAKVPANPNVDIEWDHGNAKKSRKAAQEMVNAFDIAYEPSLTSNHILGLAVDMTITWTSTIKVKDKDGKEHKLGHPYNGAQSDKLHKIGKSYGVKKLLKDPPHWSIDGR
jgi:hypothetical protein